jgi:hypothetical protein
LGQRLAGNTGQPFLLMKKLTFAILAAIVAIALVARATIFNPSNLYSTTNVAIMTAPASYTNYTGSAFFLEADLYHTFQAYNSGASNEAFAIDRSLDGINWVVVGTNLCSSSNVVDTTTTVGHWSYFRCRQIGTNSAITVTYLGGN